jgi:Na+-driven multidrug efflux pump
MKTFWETKYKLALTTLLFIIIAPAFSSKPLNDFLKWLNDDEDINPLADEYARYIAEP